MNVIIAMILHALILVIGTIVGAFMISSAVKSLARELAATRKDNERRGADIRIGE